MGGGSEACAKSEVTALGKGHPTLMGGSSLVGWTSLVRHRTVWLLMYSLSVATSSSFSPSDHSYCNLEVQRAICRCRMSMPCLTTGLINLASAWHWLSMHVSAIAFCNSPFVPVISRVAIFARSYFVMLFTSVQMSRSRFSFSQHISQGVAMSFSRKAV